MANEIYTAQEMREEADTLDEFCRVFEKKSRTPVMLRYAAEVVERYDKAVESMHTQLMYLANEGKTTVDIGRLSKYFAHLENILRDDAGKEET